MALRFECVYRRMPSQSRYDSRYSRRHEDGEINMSKFHVCGGLPSAVGLSQCATIWLVFHSVPECRTGKRQCSNVLRTYSTHHFPRVCGHFVGQLVFLFATSGTVLFCFLCPLCVKIMLNLKAKKAWRRTSSPFHTNDSVTI